MTDMYIEWNAETDMYHLTVAGQGEIARELRALKDKEQGR